MQTQLFIYILTSFLRFDQLSYLLKLQVAQNAGVCLLLVHLVQLGFYIFLKFSEPGFPEKAHIPLIRRAII